MRQAVEATLGAAHRVVSSREVARAKKRRHSSHVRAESKRRQIEMKLDVFVEGIRHAGGSPGRRCYRRGAGCDLEPSLNFADFVGVLVQSGSVFWSNDFFQTGQISDERIEDASALPQTRGALLGSGAASEQAFENNLGVEFHG